MKKDKVRNAKAQLDRIVGANIRRERKLREMTREELAEILDFTAPYIGLIERGVRGAKPATLAKLAKVFNISVNSFFEEEGKAIPVCVKCESESIVHKKIHALLSPFKEEELELILPFIKWAASMRKINYKPKLT